MSAKNVPQPVEYREIDHLPGFRFGSDASVATRWMMGVKKQLGTKWRPVNPSPRPTGYQWFYIGPRKSTKPLRLDETICEAFHGPRPAGTECLHRDNDRRNCVASNLEWGIAPENVRGLSVEYRRLAACEGYDFGTDGSIWSYWGSGNDRPDDVPVRMNPTTLSKGHLQIEVKWNGRMRRFGVHHLLCIAFYGQPPEGMECRHLDGNPINNSISNLRWGYRKDNAQDQIRHGTMAYGERSGKNKLTDDQVREIRRIHANGRGSINATARQYGVCWSTIKKLLDRRSWPHVV